MGYMEEYRKWMESPDRKSTRLNSSHQIMDGISGFDRRGTCGIGSSGGQ